MHHWWGVNTNTEANLKVSEQTTLVCVFESRALISTTDNTGIIKFQLQSFSPYLTSVARGDYDTAKHADELYSKSRLGND